MITKTFKSDTTIKTLQLVQQELGPDAIVISMREVPFGPAWNPWKKKSVEIVAASSTTPPPSQPAAKPAAPVAASSIGKNISVETVEEMPDIEWVVESEKKTTAKRPAKLKLNLDPISASTPVTTPAIPSKIVKKPLTDEKYLSASLKKIHQQLKNQGVDNVLIDGLISVALETLSPAILEDFETTKKYIAQLLGAELRVQQGAGRYVSSNVVCLVGASGSGKTSTIAKLALFFSQNLQKKITWVCADTVQMGSVAEARAYTDAMGFKLELVYTPEDIKEIISQPEANDLFLVDTPSYNPCNENQMTELGKLLAEIPKRCTYLVIPATTKEMDLVQAEASLGIFNLDGLIITKLDETHTFGNVYNFARKNPVPLGYYTVGREAARHLEVVDPARLVSALFGKEWNK
jgi:flagellar biosynthesis protein FlhF